MWYWTSFVWTRGSQPADRPSGGKLWQWVSTTRAEAEPTRLHPVPKYSAVDSSLICALLRNDGPTPRVASATRRPRAAAQLQHAEGSVAKATQSQPAPGGVVD